MRRGGVFLPLHLRMHAEGARLARVEGVRVTATEELPAVAGPGLAMGRYRLGARLGAGGFGTVYAARDERLGRPVAVKVVPAEGTDPERAQREARAVARLDHEGIVALFDAGEEDGCRYLVSELVEGRTLAQLEADGALSDRDVLRIGLALTDALAHAHDRGVIHRDVKPQNVIVPDDAGSRRGAAKLTDFGVAHLTGEDALTRTGDVVGTLAYMAPEQASGAGAGEHADLYALGIVLYEALAGVHPVRAGSPTATARRIGTVLAPLARHRADLPDGLCAAIDRAVLPAPEERGELEDLFDALADALPAVSDEGGTIEPHPLERRVLRPPARGRPRRRPRRDGRARLCRAGRAHARAGGRARRGRRRRRRGRPPCSRARAGWRPRSPSPACSRSRPSRGRARRCSCWRWRSPPRCSCAATGAPGRCPPPRRCSASSGLAGAYPALAGRAPGWAARAALGALGAWWVVLAEPLLERALVLGPAPGTPARARVRRRRGHHRRRRDRARDELGRAAARGDLGRRGAGAAVAGPRPLPARRRGGRDRLGGGHRGRRRGARGAPGAPPAARPRGRRGGRRRRRAGTAARGASILRGMRRALTGSSR